MPRSRYGRQIRARTEDTPGAQSLSSGGHQDLGEAPGAALSLGKDRAGGGAGEAPGSERDKAAGDTEGNTEGAAAGVHLRPILGARQLH